VLLLFRSWHFSLIEKIVLFIQEQSGITFDPVLAKIFIDNTERFVAIHQQYAD